MINSGPNLFSDSDKATVDKARKAIENRARLQEPGIAQRIVSTVKCCQTTRREKILAKGLRIIEKELDVDKLLKRNIAHNTALKALLNTN